MEIRQLELFCAVAETGSISAAARKLNLSQPPLSYHMKMLEEELGVLLFRRGPRRIEMTDAGKRLLERADTLLHLERDIAREVTETGRTRTLRVGVTPTTVPLLVPALGRMRVDRPDLRLEIHDGSTFRLLELLERYLIDCAMLRTPVSTAGFRALNIRKEPLVALGTLCILCEKEELSLSDLCGQPLILYRRYDAFIRGAFYDAGLTPSVSCLCDDARTAVSLARGGIGLAAVPLSIAEAEADVPFCRLAEPALETEILLVSPDGRDTDSLTDVLAGVLGAQLKCT